VIKRLSATSANVSVQVYELSSVTLVPGFALISTNGQSIEHNTHIELTGQLRAFDTLNSHKRVDTADGSIYSDAEASL